MASRKEGDFQAAFIKRIKKSFPGAMVLKNDSNYIQGFPDLTILYRCRWAIIEVKRSPDEPYRPNQEYYLNKASEMSQAYTVYPENAEEVLSALQRSFEDPR